MARVVCTVVQVDLEGDHSDDVPGIEVTCGRCEHKVECFGQTDRSTKRAMVMLRDECPEGENNFYTTEE